MRVFWTPALVILSNYAPVHTNWVESLEFLTSKHTCRCLYHFSEALRYGIESAYPPQIRYRILLVEPQLWWQRQRMNLVILAGEGRETHEYSQGLTEA